jgi:polysaccharide export outer membrane protein
MMMAVLTYFLALTAQTMDSSVRVDAAMQKGSYVLGSNDRIVVRCLNADEFSQTPVRIDTDGQVTLPFVGRVELGGLTVSDAEKQLTDRLSKFIQHPQIQLNVVDSHSQPVAVFGAVRNPGAYQLEGRKTLAEVLSMAGGLRPDAGRTLKLTRRAEWGPIPLPTPDQRTTGNVRVVEINVEELVRGRGPFADIEVQPHDVISVSQAELVYVVGQVRKPGGFAMSGWGDFTVLQALSMAEGLDRSAAPKKAKILRKDGTSGRVEVPVDLARILSGHAPDTPLLSEDVLFVPNNAAKNAGMKALDVTIQTITGLAIYGRY